MRELEEALRSLLCLVPIYAREGCFLFTLRDVLREAELGESGRALQHILCFLSPFMREVICSPFKLSFVL